MASESIEAVAVVTSPIGLHQNGNMLGSVLLAVREHIKLITKLLIIMKIIIILLLVMKLPSTYSHQRFFPKSLKFIFTDDKFILGHICLISIGIDN